VKYFKATIFLLNWYRHFFDSLYNQNIK